MIAARASSTAPAYLRADIVAEPLVDRWYAWPHLIAPATAAMNVVKRHLRIMDSYIDAPAVHESAVRNPKMLGGPFIDYPERRVADIVALRERTVRERAPQLALAQAIAELDALLREADGGSLEPLYARVPEELRGYVELVYDRNDNASFRFIEPLLYRSPYYAENAQSVMLLPVAGDERAFVLSTPRLDVPGSLLLELPFRAPELDMLFASRRTPQPISELLNLFSEGTRSQALFTETPPVPYRRYDGMGARWRYFGHACVLIETQSTAILVDPVISYDVKSPVSRYTYGDLPDVIDYVLITHDHQDHILFETLLQIRHRVRTIVVPRAGGGALEDPSLRLMLEAIGFTNVRELDEFETIGEAGCTISGVPFLGEHGDLAIRSKLAYRVDAGHRSMLFAADSRAVEPALYGAIARHFGPLDVLFLGMECLGAPMSWLYGPLQTRPIERAKDKTRRLSGSDYERAAGIVDALSPREVYVYAMGQEPWLNYVMSIKYTETSVPIVASNQLLQTCRERGLVAERLFGEREMFLR